MKSGYCIQGGDNANMHAKCTDPSRCTCDCHGTTASVTAIRTPEQDDARAAILTCADCGQQFTRQNGLSRHRNQTHGVKPAKKAVKKKAPAPAPPRAVVGVDFHRPDPDDAEPEQPVDQGLDLTAVIAMLQRDRDRAVQRIEQLENALTALGRLTPTT